MFGMKLRGKQAIVRIDTNKFKAQLIDKCDEQNKLAVRAWLKARLDRIPTYTGTARGTFAPLGRTVRCAVPLVGRAGRPGKTSKNPRKSHITYGKRKFAMGFSAGGQYASYKLKVNYSKTAILCSFEFSSNLPYVAYNDVNSAPKNFRLPSNPPWHSSARGKKAWEKYVVNKAAKQLIVPREFVKVKKVRI